MKTLPRGSCWPSAQVHFASEQKVKKQIDAKKFSAMEQERDKCPRRQSGGAQSLLKNLTIIVIVQTTDHPCDQFSIAESATHHLLYRASIVCGKPEKFAGLPISLKPGGSDSICQKLHKIISNTYQFNPTF